MMGLRPLLLWALSLCSSFAIIIADPTGASNTTPPPDDPGFYNVGTILGQGSGVYLGDFGGTFWVLTANHVGGGTFHNWQTGLDYTMIGGTYTQLLNPDSSPTDLGIFQISGNPGLPNLTISSSTPGVSSALVMAGTGRAQELTQTTWDASWVEGGTPTAYTGYKYLTPANYPLTWGTNNLDGTIYTSDGLNLVHMMYMDFDAPGSSPDYEGVGATGDSGGGIFYKNGGVWELTGITMAVATYPGQPADTAVFNDVTYAANLSVYRSQILSLVPEPSTWMMLIVGMLLSVYTLHRRSALSPVRIHHNKRR